jgi:hypothetical protein
MRAFIRAAAALIALAAVALPTLKADTPQMSASEIRPGMVGIGRTVFEGTKVAEFKANIIGVVENIIGPQRNLILAKLEGGPLAQTGVIAGMSGSPVYIEDKLIGAVSYSLGSFSKEPIAGITPIAEMTAATALGSPRPAGARVHVEFPLTPEGLDAAFRKAAFWNQPFAASPDDIMVPGARRQDGPNTREMGALMRPIATPLVMSGFESGLNETIASAFSARGFLPLGAGAGSRPGEMPFDGPLKPGDAVGINFVSGDLQLGATGTVTHVEDGRVYAFGHPMYNLGPTRFPMTRAYVYTVLPSLFSSSKLSATGDVIGTFLQDRATAIAGRLGPGPAMIPVTLTLRSNRTPERVVHFQVAHDQLFTPLMTYAALLNSITSYERQFGSLTFTVKGRVQIANRPAVTFDNFFSGETAGVGAASYIVAPITAIVGNDYEAVDIQSVDVTMESTDEAKTATIERVWIDDQRPRAGRPVPLRIAIRTYRGDEQIKTIPIEIPVNARGSVAVMVSDGPRLTQLESREARSPQPRSVSQIIGALNRVRRNDTIYIKMLSADSGAVVSGELLPALPPSVLGVVEGERSGSSVGSLSSATIGEWSLMTDHALNGTRTLTVTVSPN